jgi:uncharacterized membrane protein
MKLTIFIKILLNIIIYILYVIIISILISLVAGFLLNYFNKSGIVNGSSLSYILQAIIAIFVLLITVVSRKYFYISYENNLKITAEEIIEDKKEESLEEKFDELNISI